MKLFLKCQDGFFMLLDSQKYQECLSQWFSEWVQGQNPFRNRGWKQQFERDAGIIKGYFYKLQKGKVEWDIDNLTKIANQIGIRPSEILKQIEKRLLS